MFWFQSICDLFNDIASILDCLVLNAAVVGDGDDDAWIMHCKVCERQWSWPVWVLSQHLPWESEEDGTKPQSE